MVKEKKEKFVECDECRDARDKIVRAVWKSPFKMGETLCDKCYQDILQSYKEYTRIKAKVSGTQKTENNKKEGNGNSD